jgi:DNA-binding XRE family transcriptional regulator
MPRKKTVKINLKELECFDVIVSELAGRPELSDFMIDEGIIHLKEYVPPCIKNVERAIRNLRFSYATHKYKYEEFNGKHLIDQKILAKMVGVRRETISLWEKRGFISRSYVGLGSSKFFQVEEVIAQLEKLKS